MIKKTFYDWCVEHNHQELVDRWDYELNNCEPKDIGYTSPTKFYFKCPIKEHKSSLYSPLNLTRFNTDTNKAQCIYCNSFAYYGIKNIDVNFLDKYWDYDKNNDIDPWILPFRSRKYVYIYCQHKEYHGSYKTKADNFVGGQRCSYCHSIQVHPLDSFAQWGIDNICDDFVEKYWGENNTIGPFSISPSSNKMFYIKCQNVDYHGEYLIRLYDFKDGARCSYCGNIKTHYYDSLGYIYPEVIAMWSDKNEKSPYDYSPRSSKRVYFKCNNGVHEDYSALIHRALDRGFECSKCREKTQISHLQRKIDNYIEKSYPSYTYNHEYECTFVPRNPATGYRLPYDRELVFDDNKKLIIECNGLQHYDICLFTKLKAKSENITPEEALQRQKDIDEYKKQEALKRGYYFLTIPYTAERKNQYQTLIDNKISEILSSSNNYNLAEKLTLLRRRYTHNG